MLQEILYFSEDRNNSDYFRKVFRKEYKVHIAESVDSGLKILAANTNISVIIYELVMKLQIDIGFLREASDINPEVSRIVITGYVNMELVINAINLGHVNYYATTPWNYDEMQIIIKRAIKIHHFRKKKVEDLRDELNKLKREVDSGYNKFRLKISVELRMSIKQYLTFFSEFILQAKGLKIVFEVQSTNEGLDILIGKDHDQDVINNYLNEYMGFLKENLEDISPIMTSNSNLKRDILEVRLKQEIRHLRSCIEIEKVKTNFLTQQLNRMQDLIINKQLQPINISINNNSTSTVSVKNKVHSSLSEIDRVVKEFNQTNNGELQELEEIIKSLKDSPDNENALDRFKKKVEDICKTGTSINKLLKGTRTGISLLNTVIEECKKLPFEFNFDNFL